MIPVSDKLTVQSDRDRLRASRANLTFPRGIEDGASFGGRGGDGRGQTRPPLQQLFAVRGLGPESLPSGHNPAWLSGGAPGPSPPETLRPPGHLATARLRVSVATAVFMLCQDGFQTSGFRSAGEIPGQEAPGDTAAGPVSEEMRVFSFCSFASEVSPFTRKCC